MKRQGTRAVLCVAMSFLRSLYCSAQTESLGFGPPTLANTRARCTLEPSAFHGASLKTVVGRNGKWYFVRSAWPAKPNILRIMAKTGSRPLDHPRSARLTNSSEQNSPTQPAQAPVPTEVGSKCLRCDGSGHLAIACELCSGRGVVVLSCRKCAGTGTYSQQAGPCSRCAAKGVLDDGTQCPRCKGAKTQVAFSSSCSKCAGTGSVNLPCKKCHGSLKAEVSCKTCNGTGIFRR